MQRKTQEEERQRRRTAPSAEETGKQIQENQFMKSGHAELDAALAELQPAQQQSSTEWIPPAIDGFLGIGHQLVMNRSDLHASRAHTELMKFRREVVGSLYQQM